MGRPPCCDKSNVKRGLWTAEEDAKILAYISTHGTGNWTSVPKKAGLKRCGKSCRLRWTNYLRPDLKHESFTPQEEELIVNLHAAIGSRWSIIADQLPGRTDNDVKNHWNTKLRKKLFEKGIDPITHKPMSQIAAYYQSIGFSKSTKSPTTTSTYHTPKSTPKPMMPNTLTTMNNNNNNQPTNQEIFYNNHTLYNANLHMISFDEASSSIAPPSLMQDDHTNNDCSGSSSSFSWSDFLLDEELLSPCKGEQPQSQCTFAAPNGLDVDGGGCSGFMDEVIVSQGDLNGVGSSSTSLDGSFMEGFYDEDSGMWELAEFLNDETT